MAAQLQCDIKSCHSFRGIMLSYLSASVIHGNKMVVLFHHCMLGTNKMIGNLGKMLESLMQRKYYKIKIFAS